MPPRPTTETDRSVIEDDHRSVGEGEPRALLIDRHSAVVRSAQPGSGPGSKEASGVVRYSLDRLRRCGVRVGVLDADRAAPWPPPYRVLEAILGPVDVWCGVERSGRRDHGLPVHPDGQVIVTASVALGLDPQECAVVTDDPDLLEAARTLGSLPVLGSPEGSPRQLLYAAVAFAGTVNRLVSDIMSPRHATGGRLGDLHSLRVAYEVTATSLPA
jgi:hypothetical protein